MQQKGSATIGANSERTRAVLTAILVACVLALVVGGMFGTSAVGQESSEERSPDSPITIGRVTPTVLFVEDGGSERQLIDVSVNNSGDQVRATFTAEANGQRVATGANVPPGVSTQRIKAPPSPNPGPVPLTITVDPGAERFETQLPYQRRWEYHLAPLSHLDIGYTDVQPVVQDKQNEILDQAVAYCGETADYPEDSKFRWSIESAWVLENYVEERPPGQLQRLVECIKSGQIEVSGSYVNNLHDLTSTEQLVRQVYPGARRFEERFGVDVVSAFENDSPAVTWQYVQALKKAGINNLFVGANPVRAPQAHDKPALFWWEAPDGSRLLTWYASAIGGESAAAYSEGARIFPNRDARLGFDTAVNNIDRRLRAVAQAGYEHDLYMAIASRGDNREPDRAVADFARRFNKTYSSPKVVVSTPERYFEEVKERGTDDLPVNRGDWSDWWVDGAGSSARETDLTRDAQDRLTSAETLGSMATLTAPSDGSRQGKLDEAYRQANLYTEHTWGPSVALPYFDDPTNPQWEIKKGYAEDADRLSEEALGSALSDLGSRVKNEAPWPAVSVFNGLSWARSDVVEASVREGRLGDRSFRLFDGDEEVPYELLSRSEGEVRVRFVARGVPPLGYKTYALRPAEGEGATAESADPALRATEAGLENEFFRVELDPETGSIESILDKRRNKELVDQDARYDANQFVYRPNAAGANNYPPVRPDRPTSDEREWTPASGEVRVVSEGPVSATVEVAKDPGEGGDVSGVRSITERITLHARVPRVDISNTVDKERVETAEEAYYAFPFEVDSPNVNYEVPGAQVEFFRDQLPGSALDWQAIGRYADLSNAEGGVTFSAESAPIVEFGRIRTQEFLTRPGRLDGKPDGVNADEFLPKSGHVFSYTHNNLWFTNYRIAQEGPVTFDYSIGSHGGGFDAVRETRFGWGAHAELAAVGVEGSQQGPYAPGAHSLASVDQPNVVVQAVKRAHDGQPGLTVRLLEVAGKDGRATLRLPFKVGKATLADATERPQSALAVRGNQFTVPYEGHGIVTVLVQPELALTATAASTNAARGETIEVTVALRNEGSRPISGSLLLGAPAPLTVTPASSAFAKVAPGQTAKGVFEVAIPADAKPGPVTLTASARVAGAEITPTQLALDVVNPVDLVATPSEPDLIEGRASTIEVTATNNRPRTMTTGVRLEAPEGWAVEPPEVPVALEAGESKTVGIKLTPPEGSFGKATLAAVAEGASAPTRLELEASVSRPVAMVGEVNKSAGGFALSPNGFRGYTSTFPNDVDFTFGQDDPKAGWSYIHPGPRDGWAGSRSHDFTFRFDLKEAPAEDLTFTAWLLDTNPTFAPAARVSLNGGEGEEVRLPAGGGDGYRYDPARYSNVRPTSFDVTLPASRLRAGENAVTVETVAGSWMVYDAFGVRQRP
jgi:alpha-mannosidase